MIKTKIPTFLGIILLVFSVVSGLWLLRRNQSLNLKLGAQSANPPKEVKITNVTNSSFSVSWITEKPTGGLIVWGGTKDKLDKTQIQDNLEGLTHIVNLRNLNPNTKYFFKIKSQGSIYDNLGVLWEAGTASNVELIADNILISGNVKTEEGDPAKGALVYLEIEDATPLSTITSDNGSFVLSISEVRSSDLGGFVSIDETETLLKIKAKASLADEASAEIYPVSAKPIPDMILGEKHDFKDLKSQKSGEIPKADVELPNEIFKPSGFVIQTQSLNFSSKPVTITNIKNNQVVSGSRPEFSGDGPQQTQIRIKIDSPTTIEGQTQTNTSGNWKWTPSQKLSAGAHKITISWKDPRGISRVLSRTFIVQAVEEKTSDSSPTGSVSPTLSPTAEPLSESPSPTPEIPVAEITPAPSSEPLLPPSGSLTPTLVLTIMGLGLAIAGFVIWQKSGI